VRRVIVRMIMEQSLAITLASFAFAWLASGLIEPRFPRTLVFLPQGAVTFLVMLAGGVAASLMAIWHALRTPPQVALGG
jgi:putative ABC transport system permease protein